MSNASALTYPYKPKKLIMALCFIFFGLCAWIMVYKSITNDRGLTLIILRHIAEISFSPSEATLFYASLSVVGIAFSLAGLFGFYKALTSTAQVVLKDDSISIPMGIFKPNKTVTIPFTEIVSLEISKVNRQRFLKIVHKTGKTTLSEGMLPKKTVLDEIFEILTNKA